MYRTTMLFPRVIIAAAMATMIVISGDYRSRNIFIYILELSGCCFGWCRPDDYKYSLDESDFPLGLALGFHFGMLVAPVRRSGQR